MTTTERPDSQRKKQLGQYFTGRPVGRLLAALAGAEDAHSIIDPMVGSADLLAACLEVGARPRSLVGYDIDPLAIEQARVVLEGEPGVYLEASDAFSAKLPVDQFDLVITNPPYIRYQSKGEFDGLSIPSARTVRDHLVQQIKGRQGLSPEEMACFTKAALSYPGTSDVAVPAWILSASLVREGGVLAVVAPQTWLNRNYAQVVRELLDRAYDVEAIVEDGDASWFDDALVRTNLVVARRRAIGRTKNHSIVVGRATKQLETRGSLLGTHKSEQSVARALRCVTSSAMIPVTRGLKARVGLEISLSKNGDGESIASRISGALGIEAASVSVRTLESYGWKVGQGLRTGANDFYYLTAVDGHMKPATRWGVARLDVPSACLEPAVRRQSDLGTQLDVSDVDSLRSRVLNLRGWVTNDDASRTHLGAQVLPAQVSQWIARVAKTPFSDVDPLRIFPQLAAVAPNAKKDRNGREVAFWYQLPQFAPRHRPGLFIPRVCGGRPYTYSNSAGALIDANFATFWRVSDDAIPEPALLALLNSTWTWANLEVSSTVLGGGAMKIEATGLRRLPLPDMDPRTIERFVVLGQKLQKTDDYDTLAEIDQLVAETVTGSELVSQTVAAIAEVATTALADRSSR